MDWKDCIRHKPWLRPFDAMHVTKRLLSSTNGNAFLVFNSILQSVELHTVEAYVLSGDSVNITLSDEQLSGFLTHDFRANDMARYADQLISDNRLREQDHLNREAQRGEWLRDSMRSIERAIGTKI